MSVKNNLLEISKSIKHLQESGDYDVEKYSHSLMHLTSQLEYFYCHLVKDSGDANNTYYHISNKPKVHQLAYFNIGRGFPKELMDGHWCYILRDLGYKMLVIPCTSIKGTKCNSEFEMDIKIKMNDEITMSRIQLSDLRTVDNQRLDMRKEYCDVLTERQSILEFVQNNLFKK